MFQELYNYFLSLLVVNDTTLSRMLNTSTSLVDQTGAPIRYVNWLAFSMAFISLIIILVLCCLFIAKIVKLFGKLFSGGTL